VTRHRIPLLFTVAGSVAGLLAVAALAPVLVGTDWLKERLQASLGRRLGRPVTFERLELRYDPLPVVRMSRLRVGRAPGLQAGAVLEVDEARLEFRLEPLRRRSLKLGELVLERPRLLVAQRLSDAWQVPAVSAVRGMAIAPLALVSRLRLREGRIEFRSPGPAEGLAALALERVEADLDDIGRRAPIRTRLTAVLAGSGARLHLAGTVGPWTAAAGDPANLPVALALRLDTEEAPGPADSAFRIHGAAHGAVQMEGRLGDLAGGGRLVFPRVSLAHRSESCRSPARRTLVLEEIDLPVRIRGTALAVHPFGFRVADGSVRGQALLTWSAAGPDLRLSDVSIQGVDVARLLVDYLCHPFAVTGRLSGSGTLALDIGDPDWRRALGGQWRLDLGPGRLVGPGALTLAENLARAGSPPGPTSGRAPLPPAWSGPLDFERFAVSGTVEAGEIRAGDIRVTGPRTRIAGAGRYGLVDAQLDLRLAVETGRAAVDLSVVGPAWDPGRLAIERAWRGEPLPRAGSGRVRQDPSRPTPDGPGVLRSEGQAVETALRSPSARAHGP
jgi:hypothetical protein